MAKLIIRCPKCHCGFISRKTIREYPTKISGHPVVVKNAIIDGCSNCSFIAVSAKELKRWRNFQ